MSNQSNIHPATGSFVAEVYDRRALETSARVNVHGLFAGVDRSFTFLRREIEDKKFPIFFEDLTWVVMIDFGSCTAFHKGGFTGRDWYGSVLGCTRYIDSRRFITALLKWMDVAAYKADGGEVGGYSEYDDRAKLKGEITWSSFFRDHSTPRPPKPFVPSVMRIINRENTFEFEPGDAGRTLVKWHKSLSGEWWDRLMYRLNGDIQCDPETRLTFSRDGDEIGFYWAGMYGAHILRGEEFSSHT
jgi:hypothetical protein